MLESPLLGLVWVHGGGLARTGFHEGDSFLTFGPEELEKGFGVYHK